MNKSELYDIFVSDGNCARIGRSIIDKTLVRDWDENEYTCDSVYEAFEYFCNINIAVLEPKYKLLFDNDNYNNHDGTVNRVLDNAVLCWDEYDAYEKRAMYIANSENYNLRVVKI